MAATTLPAPIRIDLANEVPAHETVPEELRQRLEATPTKSPDQLKGDLDQARARADLLRKLELEAIQGRARRANERVKENAARKLRLQAAKVARAEAKLTKAACRLHARDEELEAKRVAAATRREALLTSVRAAKEGARQEQVARLEALASLEDRATARREKTLAATVNRSAAAVKHAQSVVANRKERDAALTSSARTNLLERLEAAADRRAASLSATVASAHGVVHAAERTRNRHLAAVLHSSAEAQSALEKSMGGAADRRQCSLEQISTRAAAANARVAEVVSVAKHAAAAKPAALQRHLVGRLQAAEVTRRLHLRSHPGAKAAAGVRGASAAPTRTSAHGVAWAVDGFGGGRAEEPSAQLIDRLVFRPRFLLATATARHLSAAGRRTTLLHLTRARAAHLGSVRVATVKGRREGMRELHRSLCALNTERAAARAAKALRAKAANAAAMGARVVSATLERSSARLALLNDCMAKETARLEAISRREARLDILAKGRWAAAATAAAAARRLVAQDQRAARGAAAAHKCLEASARRDARLSMVVSKARMASLKREVPAKLASLPGQHVAAQLGAHPALAAPAAPAAAAPPVDASAVLDARIDAFNCARQAEVAAAVRAKAMAALADLRLKEEPWLSRPGAQPAATNELWLAKWTTLECALTAIVEAGAATVDEAAAKARDAAVAKAAAVSEAAAKRAADRAADASFVTVD